MGSATFEDLPRDGDDALLDRAFEEALTRLRNGEEFDPSPFLKARPHLGERISAVERLARETLGLPVAPREVSGFSILGELGRGGMGVVYLARQDRLSRKVALKVLPGAWALSPRARDRFRAEAQALAKLRHPSIVAVIDVVEQRDLLGFAMEYVEGATLAEVIHALRALDRPARIEDVESVLRIAEGSLRSDNVPALICRIGVAIARALEAAHGASLLHRDVKPSNILLRRDGSAVLSDFGLVHDEDSSFQTGTGQFLGTPNYASPEQFSGTKLDERSDVFSLGVTLYEALALALPYPGNSAAEIQRNLERGAAPNLRRADRRLPRDLDTIIAKAISPAPDQRYSSAREFAEDLERFLRLEPIVARPPGRFERLMRWIRRHRAVLLAAVAAAVVVASLASLGVREVIERRERPARAREYARLARRALFDAGFRFRVFDTRFAPYEDLRVERLDGIANPLRTAIADYDRALELDSSIEEIVLERACADAVLALRDSREPDREALAERCPETARYFERVATVGDVRAAPALGDASPRDLRALGFLAFLLADTETQLAAWNSLQLTIDGDPLVDGMTGIVLLERGRAEAAYPRILTAHREWPELLQLRIDLADAAQKCGDLDVAENWLRSTNGVRMPNAMQLGIKARVLAQIAMRRGRVEDALSIFEAADRLTTRGFSGLLTPEASIEYARLLEARGRFDEAIRVIRIDWTPVLDDDRVDEIAEFVSGLADDWVAAMPLRRRLALSRRVEPDWRIAIEIQRFFVEHGLRGFEPARTDGAVNTVSGTNDGGFGLEDVIRASRVHERAGPRLAWWRELEVIEILAPAPGLRRCLVRIALESPRLAAVAGTVIFVAAMRRRESAPPTPRLRIGTSSGTSSVGSLAAAGDLDVDGVPDLIVGLTTSTEFEAGRIEARSGRDGSVLWRFEGAPFDGLQRGIAIGDANRDGVDDVIVATGPSRAFGLRGFLTAVDGRTGAPLHRVVGSRPRGEFGSRVVRLGDCTDDGASEIATVEFSAGTGASARPNDRLSGTSYSDDRIRIHSGADLTTLSAFDANVRRAGIIASGADWDGDGVDDLAIGEPSLGIDGGGRVRFVSTRQALLGAAPLGAPRIDCSRIGVGLGSFVVGVCDLDDDGRGEWIGRVETERSTTRGVAGVRIHAVRFEALEESQTIITGMPLPLATSMSAHNFAVIHDADEDGVRDVASSRAREGGEDGEIVFLSGRSLAAGNARILARWEGGVRDRRLGREVEFLGDLDGDGVPELGAIDFGEVGIFDLSALSDRSGRSSRSSRESRQSTR